MAPKPALMDLPIKTAMVIGALPFSLVMVLMGAALIKGIYLDGLRDRHGMPTTIEEAGTALR
jgi:choline/glycine/proline betaine transport protein